MGDNPQSFDYAILYVGSMGLIGLISYLFIVGPLDRITLTPSVAQFNLMAIVRPLFRDLHSCGTAFFYSNNLIVFQYST